MVGWVVHIGGDHGVDATEMGHEFTHRPPQVVDRLVEVASARAGEVGAVGSDVVEIVLRSHPVKLPGLRGSARDDVKARLPDGIDVGVQGDLADVHHGGDLVDAASK